MSRNGFMKYVPQDGAADGGGRASSLIGEPTSPPPLSMATPSLLLRVAPLAADLTAMLMRVRESCTKAMPTYVENKRRDINRGTRVRPFECELAMSFADLEDGAPIGQVTEPYRVAIAMLELRGRELAHGDTEPSMLDLPVLGLVRREQRLQAAEDDAAILVIDNEQDPARLQAYLRAAQAEIDAQLETMSAVRARLANLMGRRQPVTA